jgi:predicted GNAT family N-acyltransferase
MPELKIYPPGEAFPLHLYYQVQAFIRIFWVDDEGFDIDFGLDEPVQRIVIAHGKSLISYATIVRREIDLAGETYQCAGLGDMMTFPAFRKQGYGGQVAKAATEIIQADASFDVALLWTAPHNTQFYARYGWIPMPNMTTTEGESDAPDVMDDEPAMMLFLSEKGKAGMSRFQTGRVYIGEEGKW